MKITYNDAITDFRTYIKNKGMEQYLSVETANNLKIPPALDSVQMLEDTGNIVKKIDFVYYMLQDNSVTIKFKEEELCSFQVNKGMTFNTIEYFNQHPAIYRYFIDAVFGVFLKNSYPLLSESLGAENQ